MDAPQAPSIAIPDVSLNTAAGLSAVAGGSEQVQPSVAAVIASTAPVGTFGLAFADANFGAGSSAGRHGAGTSFSLTGY